MNTPKPTLLEIYNKISQAGLATFVGGSVGAMYFGEPRATLDLDLVVKATEADSLLFENTFDRDLYFLPPKSVIQKELRKAKDGSFQILDLRIMSKADIYIVGNDELLNFGMENRLSVRIDNQEVSIPPADYLVLIKLKYHSISRQEKHLDDIRSILRLSPQELNQQRITQWSKSLGAEKTWEALLGENQ